MFRIPKAFDEKVLKNYKKSEFDKFCDELGFIDLSSPNVINKVRLCLPTGLPTLDVVSAKDKNNLWGMPFGRQIEFSGNPDSGKTTMLINLAAASQAVGYKTVWIETEYTLNSDRAENLGLDKTKLKVYFPKFLEQGLERIDALVEHMPERGEKGYKENDGLVILFDSIAATPTAAEVKGKVTDSHVAEFARRMAQFQRRLNSKIARRNVMIVYSNQMKAKIGVMFGKKSQTYGGNAIRYHASLRFECKNVGRIRKSDNVVGIKIELHNEKNKCFIPYKKTQAMDFMFDGGFNKDVLLVDALIDRGLIRKSGKNYIVPSIGSKHKIERLKLVARIKEDAAFRENFVRLINAT